MQEVEASCERVLMISRGKLVADSTVPDLLQSSQLARTIHMEVDGQGVESALTKLCLLYTYEAADERSSVDLSGRRIIK